MLTPSVALLLLAHPAPAPRTAEPVRLTYAPAEGTTLRRTLDSTATFELDAVEMALDGEPPPVDLPEPDLSIEGTESLVVVDRIEAVADGRPTVLERRFEALAWGTEFSNSEGDEADQAEVCDLEGETVTFRWDADDEEYARELGEDASVDEEQLAYLDADMDYRAFLPDDEVEVDDTWSLGADAYLALVWPGGVLVAYTEGEEVDEVQLEMTLALVEDVDCEGEATLEELVEEDGRTIAVIAFELEVAAEGEVEVDVDAGTVVLRREVERTIEGRLRWDVEAGHALGLEAEAEGDMRSVTVEPITDPEGGEHELEQVQEFSGTIRYDVTIERE